MNLVWLRNDLRAEDNPALWHACADGPTLCVFALTPGQWREHHDAPAKISFLLAQLESLAAELRALKIPLKLIRRDRFDELPDAFATACPDWGVRKLWFNRELPLNEQRRDDAVQSAMQEAGVDVRVCDADLIHNPGTVLTGSGAVYQVFTPFYKRWLALLPEARLEPLDAPQAQQYVALDSDSVPAHLDGLEPGHRSDLWPVGAEAASTMLHTFLARRHAAYAEQRDFPGNAGTSTLSPYLTAGVLSIRQCIRALRATELEGSWENSEWLAELVWREFYRHLMAARPELSMGKDFKPFTGPSPWQSNEQGWQAWCDGQTGFPLVDAAMRQLNQTGWMHNRLRMVTATFLTKLLLIDWRRGEQYFMEHLLDGDFASNNGGWQWASSTGADAAPYFRIFNPLRQSQRFDAQGKFIKRFVPELSDLGARQIHDPDATARRQTGYPEPVIDYAAARKQALERFEAARA